MTALLNTPSPATTEGVFHPADVAARLDRLVDGRTVPAEFLDTARRHLDRVALRWAEGTTWNELTWSEYEHRVARIAGGLRSLGVDSGDRVLLLLRNGPAFHLTDMAVLCIGATPVSIYLTSSPEQIDHVVDGTGARLAIVEDAELLDRLLASDAVTESGLEVVVVDTEGVDTAEFLPLAHLETHEPIDLDEAIAMLDPDAAATIIHTSGTTGPSKGVVLSHRNVLWASRSIELALGDRDLTGKRILSYLPMAHIAERSTSHYSAAISGYEVNSCQDPADLADHLREVRPHLLFGVPRVWEKLRAGVESAIASDPERRTRFAEAIDAAAPIRRALLDGPVTDDDAGMLEFLDLVAFAPVRDALGLDRIEVAVTGAAPIRPETIEWFRTIGIPLTEIYGMTESSGPIAWTPDEVGAGTIGPVIPGAELRLADDGEILFRGGNVFEGYLDRPDATNEAIDEEGWLHTGDIGELDGRGHLRIVDRKKELIVTEGGKNVSPANLEAALRSIPLVDQACAVGDGRPYVAALITLDVDELHAWELEHERSGVDPRTFEVDASLVASLERAVEEVMERFSRAERVKRIAVLTDEWSPDSEHLTPTLKLRRRAIHQHYAERIDQLYR